MIPWRQAKRKPTSGCALWAFMWDKTKTSSQSIDFIKYLAEAVRFELTDGRPSLVFKTSALNRSATLPNSSKPFKNFQPLLLQAAPSRITDSHLRFYP
jgi:hypothetical protein